MVIKDKQALTLVKGLKAVPVEVRKAVLSRFVDGCKTLNSIAFMQWRMRYPTSSCYHDMKELEDIIQTRIFYITNFFKEEQVTSKKTRQLAALPEDFLQKYNMDYQPKNISHSINSFAQVGIEDPFPSDYKTVKGSLYDMDEAIYKLPQGVTDLVYSESRYV